VHFGRRGNYELPVIRESSDKCTIINFRETIGSHVVKYRIFIIILLAVFCVSCYPTLVAKLGPKVKFKEHKVKYWVKNRGGVLKLEPHPSNNGCPGIPGTGKGCVKFEVGTLGTINLSMFGGTADKNCADSPQPDYVITKVELTAQGTGDKGVFPLADPAPGWLTAAFPTIELPEGIVYEASLSDASESAVVLNLNNNDPAKGVKTSWYRVTVQDCVGGAPIVSDPQVPNHGNN